jgi:hypothetical protein
MSFTVIVLFFTYIYFTFLQHFVDKDVVFHRWLVHTYYAVFHVILFFIEECCLLWMLHHMALVRTNVSEECITSITRFHSEDSPNIVRILHALEFFF